MCFYDFSYIFWWYTSTITVTRVKWLTLIATKDLIFNFNTSLRIRTQWWRTINYLIENYLTFLYDLSLGYINNWCFIYAVLNVFFIEAFGLLFERVAPFFNQIIILLQNKYIYCKISIFIDNKSFLWDIWNINYNEIFKIFGITIVQYTCYLFL